MSMYSSCFRFGGMGSITLLQILIRRLGIVKKEKSAKCHRHDQVRAPNENPLRRSDAGTGIYTYLIYTAPTMVTGMLASTIAFVTPPTTDGRRGRSLVMSRYVSATARASAEPIRFDQHNNPNLPFLIVIYIAGGRKMRAKNRSTQVRLTTASVGGTFPPVAPDMSGYPL